MRQTLYQTACARRLRREMSAPERGLWEALRGRRFRGLKFRRQVPLGPYIVAFYCAELRLVLDVVSSGEAGAGPRQDPDRAAWLLHQGFAVFRTTRHEIASDPSAILARIAAFAG